MPQLDVQNSADGQASDGVLAGRKRTRDDEFDGTEDAAGPRTIGKYGRAGNSSA